MTAMKDVKLFCRYWLNERMGEPLPVTEPEVRIGLTKMISYDIPDEENLEIIVAAIARTGGVFMLAEEDREAWAEFHGVPDELPPLPYPRIWIECQGEDGPAPLAEWDEEDDDGPFTMQTMAVVVNELEQGSHWAVTLVNVLKEDESWAEWSNRAVIFRNEFFDFECGENRPPDDELLDPSEVSDQMMGALGAVFLLDLLGAVHEPIAVPRQSAREFKRRYGFRFATAYFVNLRSTGDEPPKPGDGTKEFHCRWIVRGHYARHRFGTIWRENKKSWCCWVPPYVKGPVGAPWKGRPIYTTLEME